MPPAIFPTWPRRATATGAAAADFDDRAWRTLDLPHDWAVEVPFDGRGSDSHGYKAIGRNFPETSVGWYRKSFFIPASDLGRRISVEFDGVFRDSLVWVNGHYLGNEPSGYTSFGYNLSEFLNYGGNNVIAVRVDATMEEGWFYEGAGIYRHVWLVKTDPLHVERPMARSSPSEIKTTPPPSPRRVIVINEGTNTAAFDVEQTILDAGGNDRARRPASRPAGLKPWESGEFTCVLPVASPKLWSIETPILHKLVTTTPDRRKPWWTATKRRFGIRSIRFDPDQGFFLNGQRVELKGSNNHQDHAGVGAAIPDALQEFRIARLKEMGGNAYRCSHNPPTPELLDACDRLGMVVIDENRLMGTAADQLDHLKQLILRDRNHPSVILWSLGNEEWAIEGNVKGARIPSTMQAFAKRIDPTRPHDRRHQRRLGRGISTVIDVVGYNYINQSNPDHAARDVSRPARRRHRGNHHARQPAAFTSTTGPGRTWRPLEDGSTRAAIAEKGWKYYAARPFLAGLFYWTGFDYRGEPTPFGWPAISSQFGILDTCGFPKDGFYYLKSWWTDEPVLHVFPALELAGQRRPGNQRLVLQQLRRGRTLPQRPEPRPKDHGEKRAPRMEGQIRARHLARPRLQGRARKSPPIKRRNHRRTRGNPARSRSDRASKPMAKTSRSSPSRSTTRRAVSCPPPATKSRSRWTAPAGSSASATAILRRTSRTNMSKR